MHVQRRIRRLAREVRHVVGGAIFLLASCVTPESTREPPHGSADARRAPRAAEAPLHVVIVTLDGARAQEILGGTDHALADSQSLLPEERPGPDALTPELTALIRRGAAVLGTPDAPMRATGPNFVSLPGYTEIMTGKGPSSCKDNECRWVSERTIIDDLSAADGCHPTALGVVTSWPDIGRVVARDARCAAMSTGRTGGVNRDLFRATPALGARLDRAAAANPAPGVGDFRRDRETGALAVDFFRHYRPRFLFVGLGESDEYGHHGNYRGYLRALREADAIIGALARTLAELGRQGARTALFVTADHGRAASFRDHGSRYPESAAVWLVAVGTEIGGAGLVRPGRTRRLADLAPTIRHLFELPPDTSDRAGEVLFDLLASRGAVSLADARPLARRSHAELR